MSCHGSFARFAGSMIGQNCYFAIKIHWLAAFCKLVAGVLAQVTPGSPGQFSEPSWKIFENIETFRSDPGRILPFAASPEWRSGPHSLSSFPQSSNGNPVVFDPRTTDHNLWQSEDGTKCCKCCPHE